MPMVESCVFCAILRGDAPADVVRMWNRAIAIRPLNPVTAGHLLVIPREHVRDASTAPDVTAYAMRCAVEIARRPYNIITSAGAEATQTVFHLHLHVVPRFDGDGLALPWHPSDAAAQLRGERGEVARLAAENAAMRPVVDAVAKMIAFRDEVYDGDRPAAGNRADPKWWAGGGGDWGVVVAMDRYTRRDEEPTDA
jgi:histidine triad (HIT) family protein